jgi:hypothetical protein
VVLIVELLVCVEWTGDQGGEVQEADQGAQEPCQEDPGREEGTWLPKRQCLIIGLGRAM